MIGQTGAKVSVKRRNIQLPEGITNYRNGPQWTTTDRNRGRLGHNGPPGTARDGVSCGNRKGERLKHDRLS